jgi:hypothetical protein
MISHLFQGVMHPHLAPEKIDLLSALPGFAGLVIMGAVELAQKDTDISSIFSRQRAWVRWAVYYALILFTLFFGVFAASQFIYFQF